MLPIYRRDIASSILDLFFIHTLFSSVEFFKNILQITLSRDNSFLILYPFCKSHYHIYHDPYFELKTHRQALIPIVAILIEP